MAAKHDTGITRRGFLQGGAAALGGLAAAPRVAFGAPGARRPNLLLIICDQMNLDAMSALGNAHVRTPNLDRLAGRGVTFMESHSTNPVCSPARSSLMTGRMPVETGVTVNNLAIRAGMPNLGEWLREQAGYETLYCGKWHIPEGYATPNTRGFRALPAGGGQGAGDDAWVARTCGAYLRSRAAADKRDPFLMVASFMQPHDICYWMIHPRTLVPAPIPFAQLAGGLPALPPNHRSRPAGPAVVGDGYKGFATDLQWRYYLYCYYRMVEMLDHDVGRLLDALDDTGLAENTVVLFTSDHGEGAGRHGNVQKWHPYDESMKVPFLCAGPGVRPGQRDGEHLVSGLDVMSTFCDYAGVKPPPGVRGLSVRPLLEGRPTEWREFLVSEWRQQGHIVRTPQYKLVTYAGDPAVQLFDMRKDPWEMDNLAEGARYADTVRDHRALLEAWEKQMDVAPAPANVAPKGQGRRR